MGFLGPLGIWQISARVLKLHMDRALREMPPPPPGARILDAGCGQGLWGLYLLRRWPGASLHGVDIRPDRVAACRAAASRETKASFEIGDLHTFAEPEAYDIVLCLNAIHYRGMRDVDILRRLGLALRPQGRLLFIGPMARADQPLHFARNKIDPGYPGYRAEMFRAQAADANLRVLTLRPIVGARGTLAKELSWWVQPHPALKILCYPLLTLLALLDQRDPARAYYLLAVMTREQTP